MKINRNSGSFGSSFDTRSRRRGRLPIVPIILLLLFALVIWFLWSRGGEQPQQRVEKLIPAEKLGK